MGNPLSLRPQETVTDRETPEFGGSSAAIRHHYDVSNAFFRLWLDESLTYSCALWTGADTLALAQRAKIDYHLDKLGLPASPHLLDIGCGWGALLRRALERFAPRAAVGLTLSEAQAEHVSALRLPNVTVRLENWAAHEPNTKYDGIVSIGALEHFAAPLQSQTERIAVYRTFFERCRAWLSARGALSLQTIVYGDMDAGEANGFITTEIFPQAELPRPQEIFAATDKLFEVVSYRNDRLDYARTCETWLTNLRRRRMEAVVVVGEDVCQRYERYLMLSAIGFQLGRIGLARLRLVPYRARRGNTNP